jgi:signal transduction histidine kinase
MTTGVPDLEHLHHIGTREQALAAVFEASPVGIGLMDKSGRIVLANRKLERFLPTGVIPSHVAVRRRWRAEDAAGRPIEPREWPGARALRGEAIVPGLEMLFTEDDGRQTWTRVSAVPLIDANGETTGAVIAITDNDAEKRAKAELRENEARFRALITATSYAVYRMSADGSEMLQLDGRGFIADVALPTRSWMDVYIHPADHARVRAAIEQAIRAKSTFELEHRVRRLDGTSGWTLSRAVPLLDGNSRIVEWFGAASEITERKEFEKRQAFLLELNDGIRPLVSAEAVTQTACRMLVEHLDASRAQYIEVKGELGAETGMVRGEFVRVGEPMPRRFSFDADSEPLVATLQRGERLVLTDMETDGRLNEAQRAALRRLDSPAAVAVPLLKGGRLTSIFMLHHLTPRDWTEAELELVSEVAERTWAAVERAHAEAALRESEEQQAFLLRLSDSLRPLEDAQSVQATAARLLGQHLRVNRVQYAEALDDEDVLVGGPGYTDGVTELRGKLLISDFDDEAGEAYRAGRSVVIPDAGAPDRPAVRRSAFEKLGIGAALGVPLLKAGRLIGVLNVHHSAPRDWTPAEITLVEQVAERTWEALQRARTAAAVRVSEEQYRSLFESIDQGFCVIELLFDDHGEAVDYRYIEVNEAFKTHTGIENAAGRRILEFVPAIEPYWLENYREVVLSGTPVRFSGHVTGLNRWFEVYAFKVGGPESNRLAVIFADITQRQVAEEQRERLMAQEQAARERAEAAARLRDEFLATVSHELRTPLTAILLWTRVLDEGGLGPDQLKAVHTIRDNAQAQQQLIEDLLDASRIMAGTLTVQRVRRGLAPIVETAADALRPAADEKGVKLTVSTEPVTARVDKVRLLQVLGNVLDNALRHTPAGGTISVSMRQAGEEAVIEVSDTGSGVEPELLPFVFDRFRSGRDEDGGVEMGLGLGLAISKELVEAHAGTIRATSAGPGQGTTVTIGLQAARTRARPA